MRSYVVVMMLLASAWAGATPDEDEKEKPVLINEEFADLKQWKPLEFPKIEKHSEYETGKIGGRDVLICTSDASASGLALSRSFDVTRYPRMSWRWKVDNVFKKGDATEKKGDDYPIRLYVVFKYDPSQAGLAMRAKYGLAKKLYGEYPPHSGLNYIWANRKHEKRQIVSPYTSRSIMIVRQAGDENAGKWMEEDVNILDDYRKAFGEDPPAEATLIIMTDADNTGESAKAYLDYVRVSKRDESEKVDDQP